MHIFQSIDSKQRGIHFEIPTTVKNEILKSAQSNNLLSKLNSVFVELNGCWPAKALTEAQTKQLDDAGRAIIDAMEQTPADAVKAIDKYKEIAISVGRAMQEGE